MSLQTVGIDKYTCPVRIQEKSGGCQQTVATINLLASMPCNRLES